MSAHPILNEPPVCHRRKQVCFRAVVCSVTTGCLLISFAWPVTADEDPSLAAGVQVSESASGTASESPEAILNSQIEQLVSDSFEQRQAAAMKLRELPADQVPLLLAAAERSEQVEVVQRVMALLDAFYVSDDAEKVQVASELLETAAANPRWSVAESSRDILNRHESRRFALTRTSLEQMGAFFSSLHSTSLNGVFRQPFSAGMLQVNLDSEWKGSERGLQLLVRLAEMFDPSSPAGSPRVGLYLIDGHPLKDEDVVVLKAAFGDARVVSRGKVCLGITNDPSRNDATGCRVSEVRRGTSADQGGIQPGDLIVAVDQVRIKDFDHLVELLKDYDIGVVVKMEILREPDLSGRFDAPRGPLFPEFRQLQEPPLEPEKPDNSDDDVKPDDRLRNRRRTLDVKLLGWRSVQSLEDE